MPSPLQQPAVRRKLIYLGLIVLLFTLSLPYRKFIVAAQADRMDLREQNLGEVELTGSAIRLTLTGSRGLVICSLWMAADEAQKRNELNKLELIVNSLTKLQSHSASVWLYLGWNLIYNVPPQLEEGKDQYFYISRGLQVLEEGSRRLHHNPDLRLMIGHYYEHRLGFGDDSRLLQTLFQMSLMDPRERDPRQLVWTRAEQAANPRQFEQFCKDQPQLRTATGDWVHPQRFEEFCRKHPQLARRLRERRIRNEDSNRVWYEVRPRSPGEVVTFLARNEKIPGRFRVSPQTGKLELAEQPFPVLPPGFELTDFEPQVRRADDFDPFLAARAWYQYAQQPVPPPDGVLGPRELTLFQGQYRLPRAPALILFRQKPALAQTFAAQRLQQEGWFDEGWAIDEGREGRNQWFPGRTVVVGAGRDYAGEAWKKAHELWTRYGEQSGLADLPPAEDLRLNVLARKYRAAFGVKAEETSDAFGQRAIAKGPDLLPEQRSGDMGASYDAHRRLYWYEYWRDHDRSNFPFLYSQAAVESRPEARAARKLFYKAEQLRKRGEPADVVLRVYDQAFEHWKYVLLGPRVRPELLLSIAPLAPFLAALPWPALPLCSREIMALPLPENRCYRRSPTPQSYGSGSMQEETHRLELRYRSLLQEVRGTELKQLLVLQDYLTQATAWPAGVGFWLPSPHLLPSRSLPVPLVGPFDTIVDMEGKPLIEPEAKGPARERLGVGE